MRRAYKAVLHGDRVEWLDGAPEAEGPVQVYITFSEISVSANPNSKEGRPLSCFRLSLTWAHSLR